MNTLKFGLTSIMTPFQVLTNKSNFGNGEYSVQIVQDNNLMRFLIIISVLIILLGFVAVGRICRGNTDKARRTRLILYILLVLTGGNLSIAFILFWMFGITIN